jgi:hypothetical protein
MPGHLDILLRILVLSGNKFIATLFRFVLIKGGKNKFFAFILERTGKGTEVTSI